MNRTEFESFEQQFLELVGELQTITCGESRLRDALRMESTRAEAAEAAREAAERAAAEARSTAAAAAASTAHVSQALAKTQDELAATKMQFELAERHREILEEKCSEMTSQVQSLNTEIQKLRPLQVVHSNLQRQYTELQDRVHNAMQEARRESTRLEAELRRVEQCAAGGAEIRDRARLAAAAHVRERKLAAAELQHTSHELHNAKAESIKLSALVAELQYRLSKSANESSDSNCTVSSDPTAAALAEVRAALVSERAGAARLEQALAAAVADNATLAASLHAADNNAAPIQPTPPRSDHTSTNICPIDTFLAD